MPAWPLIFITVSCGAVSGFHATQSPLTARCLKSEKHMRLVFYGAMISEGVIALVWAGVAQGFYGDSEGLAAGGPGSVVYKACLATMGLAGGGLAVSPPPPCSWRCSPGSNRKRTSRPSPASRPKQNEPGTRWLAEGMLQGAAVHAATCSRCEGLALRSCRYLHMGLE